MRSDADWRADCRQLLEMMLQRPDSLPFREPVDTIEFPDYLEIISTPMDLRTVKEDLLGGNYEDPLDFAKDVRLIFQNSKNYNTNKRSRVSYFFNLKQQLYEGKSAQNFFPTYEIRKSLGFAVESAHRQRVLLL